ncbi:pimeloyl-ACP methyl ester carboxylesterase [Saccharopolyspora erythraea NRRL 2338]|uniref:3-oxoadipate enol-lactone hydrolase/4-carboxymuconolactone decarboxylase n=2 Tax=Saccharopolyspora erythraea TaxID=1836 RepID=A4F8C3_SACEN|nr:alpha/beta hydrolase [Saccharopolyspora erythraea]EQD85331.1 alpha/beta hydrolase [Saccharopolyspora erythraea D]PFG94093.1 pimeloyl-ACP methyl ester carboxylesterase [Saccharopolyspora erythraea NRRL 2338]QRK90886.1 alpha/beta hydrolase [Saccharopolyspora erythraea]CAM00298.1 3-oxoadipate enol-lactone hydrolase/4-carboxymuconolactone decarboxylase [Saccharopolyspora erythraea NRRL 2338]
MPLSHKIVGSGPGLLLAHGATGNVEGNFPFLDELAADHTVVAADYPGSGATPRADGPLRLDDLADDLVATAVDAGVETFAILGYSMGTAVAIRAATRHPRRVSALVLTAGLTHPDRHLRLTLDLWQRLRETGDHFALSRFLLLNGLTPASLDAVEPWEETVAQAAHGQAPGADDHLALLRTVDVRADLPGIGVPTLVVATARDTLVPPHNSRRIAEGIAGARLVEIDAGHLIADERPGEWLAAVRDFLSGVAAAPRGAA